MSPPSLQTPLSKLLGIQYPIILAGMARTSGGPLAAALSNAGGLGVIGGLGYTPEQLQSIIDDLKSNLRDKNLPFGVDLALPQVGGSARKTNHDYTHGHLDELIEVTIKNGAKLFVSAVGVPPARTIKRLHEAGILIMNMVGHPKHAKKALDAGVDIVCAQGGEGGGHTGDIANSILIPAVVDVARKYKSPLTGEPAMVVAAGGIYNGRSLASSLMQGAQGVWVGTRFVASTEAGCSQMHKENVVTADFTDTGRTLVISGRPLRVRYNDYIKDWHEREDEIKKLTDAGIVPLAKDMDDGKDVDIPFLMGQVAGVIGDIKPAKEIVDDMVQEAVEMLRLGQTFIAGPSSKLEFAATDLKTVGNYTLGRLIGKGSFGKVYLASHKLSNGSRVVLKSAKKDDSNLAREIHHHRQFIHPHIARLYEVIVTEELVWLVLEYCPGDELYNYLLAKGALEPAKVQRIFTQLVGAVTYVHNKSCVHRDLKLENILLDKHENVKLVDFGFTREYEGKSNYLQTWCGTICYSAPEMLKGEKYAGEKVDVWSLGIILYALLVGELPFDDDDEIVTKTRILKEEPKYPENFPQQARELCQLLLSKRPILRPTLADILQNPWLSEHAPRQQEILKLQQPAPFSTELEKEVLHRMRAAGVDIDMVIENVLAQRCDSLAGWWALRLDKLAPTIREMDEEGLHSPSTPKSRGRTMNRSSLHGAPELPRLPEIGTSPTLTIDDKPLPPIDTHRGRKSHSTSRPPVPGKDIDRRRSRSSMLQVVSSNPDLLSPNGFVPKRRRKQPFINHLLSLRNWIKETSKRARSPGSKASGGHSPKFTESRSPDSKRRQNTTNRSSIATTPRTPQTHMAPRPRGSTHGSGSMRRLSASPAPLTPRSSYRRSSGGLRGRKSTSSSVSSIRSMPHHHHTHSKASSISSASLASPAGSVSGSHKPSKSPHNSIKVLPATPTSSSFPSNIRLVRSGFPPGLNESSAAFGNGNSIPPQSPGLVFAKRKRTPFKGPMINTSGNPPGKGEFIEEETVAPPMTPPKDKGVAL
ncbi:ProP, Permease of the major facilitator superfamily [Pyrenophora tritici-repentis]|nr:ProP, Permease of the major facilitator superfamily [Pyrenophora tritici-repentis]